jgi:hypothetical protein
MADTPHMGIMLKCSHKQINEDEMSKSEENYIEHEVKIRLQDEKYQIMQRTLDKIDSKMDSQFKWIIGTIITMFGGIILNMAKLI